MKIEKTITIVGETKDGCLTLSKDGVQMSALTLNGNTEEEKSKEVRKLMDGVIVQIDRVLQQPI